MAFNVTYTAVHMNSLVQDLRFAWRLARRERIFTAAAVLTLALGIGANTALFAVLNGSLLQPLPFPDPNRLVLAWETVPAQGVDRNTPAPATFADWRARARTVESLAPMTLAVKNITGDGEPERLLLVRASADLMPTLGVTPMIGRPFRADEDRSGGPRVLLLSYDLWARRYARDRGIVGRTVRLDGEPTTIVGVLPRDLPMPVSNVDGWTPLALTAAEINSESRMLWVFGRLAPGATRAAADAELTALIAARTHGSMGEIGARVERVDELLRGDVRPDILLAFAATAIVLLVACGNVAIMLLTRGAGRQRELALRVAVGASRSRVVRQLTAEALLLAVTGAVAGALLGGWFLGGFAAMAASADRQIVPRLDWRVLWFIGGVSVSTVLVTGVLPAFASLRRDSGRNLGAGARMTETTGARSMRTAFVIAEMALTVLLLSSATLLGRTFATLLHTDLGFNPDGVLTMAVPRTDRGDSTPDRRFAFYHALETKLNAIPGVHAVGLTNGLPVRFTGGGSGFFPEGAGKDDAVAGNHRIVNGSYFDALQIPLLEGRTFTEADRQNRPMVAVVSRAFANRAWPHRDALGQRFTWGAPTAGNPLITIVGVVGDIRLTRTMAPTPHVYLPFTQVPQYVTSDVAVRTAGDPLSIANAARAAIHDIDPNQPVAKVASYDRVLADSVGRRQFTLTLMATFGALALVLAAIGLYGVVAFVVSRRTREIGVRIALGASAAGVRVAVLRDGLRLAGVGAACGVTLSVAAARWVSAWVPGIARLDAGSIALALGLVVFTAALACDIPARRASRVDPIGALRAE